MDKICSVVLVISLALVVTKDIVFVCAIKFDFPKAPIVLTKAARNYLNTISPEEWQQFAEWGVEAVKKEKSFEKNLLLSRVTVENGSLSHVLLLDCLPNQEAVKNNDIAQQILKSSLYVYNAKCIQSLVSPVDCQAYMSNTSIPENTELGRLTREIIKNQQNGFHTFRRLLPRYYKDGLHEMYPENTLPSPRLISKKALDTNESSQYINNEAFEDNLRNLVLVQWTQFVEHDLSKPVVISMGDGSPIECCDTNFRQLLPRYRHTACAPLLMDNQESIFGHPSCLNYVRSALSVGYKPIFGAGEQLNQASQDLDLSQLYGLTPTAEHDMRELKDGKIRRTRNGSDQLDLLPTTKDDEQYLYCVAHLGNQQACFMAGDSRVNNNPLSILIYTIFMRNHNRIADQLKAEYPYWEDEQIYQTAKSINIEIYQKIIFNEWLPVVLGREAASEIIKSSKQNVNFEPEYGISNEFAVAAIRFYLSMMPNVLGSSISSEKSASYNNETILLNEQKYNPNLDYSDKNLENIFKMLLSQRAMKMDATYVSGLIWNGPNNSDPAHLDTLALDIQRGRDHGLQPYFKYLEACNNVQISSWTDFSKFMSSEHIEKLKSVYRKWSKVDLIIGGISENPTSDSTVGPTFNCILGEQFLKIHQLHKAMRSTVNIDHLNDFKLNSSAELLCMNLNLDSVPKNVFLLASERNPLVNCANILKPLPI